MTIIGDKCLHLWKQLITICEYERQTINDQLTLTSSIAKVASKRPATKKTTKKAAPKRVKKAGAKKAAKKGGKKAAKKAAPAK